MQAKLTRSGEELVIRISAAEIRQHGLRDGQVVEIRPSRGVETLAEMLAEMNRLGPAARPAPVDWGPDVGAEIIRDDYE